MRLWRSSAVPQDNNDFIAFGIGLDGVGCSSSKGDFGMKFNRELIIEWIGVLVLGVALGVLMTWRG